MISTLLVAAVGYNPASILVVARSYQKQVDGLFLVCTRQSEAVAQAVERQLGVARPIRWVYDKIPPIDSLVAELVRELPIGADTDVVLDVTGGTKPQSIALWSAVAARRPGFYALYLDPAGALWNARTGEPAQSSCMILPREVLEWREKTCTAARWEGNLNAIPASRLAEWELWRMLYKSFGGLRFNADAGEVSVPFQLNMALPSGFSRSGDRIREPPARRCFSGNEWLEDLCLMEAFDVLKDFPATTAGLAMKTAPGERRGSENDEFDVVLVRGPHVAVIEAKARRQSSKSGDDLQKRVAKTRYYFGDLAKTVFVHPAYNRDAQRTNQGNVESRLVRVVGDNLEELREALRWAMGCGSVASQLPHQAG
jgi:hypothetical protein